MIVHLITMDKVKEKQFSYLIAIFLFLALGITAAGWTYYGSESDAEKKRAFDNLEAIADFKVREIYSWRKERLADAEVLRSNPFVHKNLELINLNNAKKSDVEALQQFMDKVAQQYSYREWVVFDSNHEILVTSSKNIHTDVEHQPWFSEKIWQDPFFSDLHFEDHGTISMDLVIPITMNDTRFLILFFIDPLDYLYPLIQTWPGASTTGETILVEKSGKEILFLNDLRNKGNMALNFRTPYIDDLPAVKAVNKISLSMEGRDYQSVPVLAVTRHIEGTPWGLVTKINIEEVLSPLRGRLVFIIISSLLFVSASGIAIIFLWQRQKSRLRLSESEKYKDIAEKLQTLSSLQTAILDNAGYSIISTTPEGIITTFNSAAEKMLGYSAEEVIGKKTPEAFHDIEEVKNRARLFSMELKKEIEPGFEVFIAKARSNLPNEYEWTYIRKDGSRFPVLLSVTALRNDKKEITGFLGMAADMTRLKETERNLQDYLAFNKSIIESSPYGIAVCDDTGQCVLANNSIAHIVGATREQVLSQNFRELASWEESGLREKAEETLKTGENTEIEVHFATSFGKNIWLQATFMSTVISGKKHLLAMFDDISERKKAEEALKKEKETVQTYFDAAGVIFLVLNKDAKVTRINKRGCSILGYETNEIIGKNWFKNFIPEKKRFEISGIFKKIVAGEYELPQHYENPVITKSGVEKMISWNNIILHDREGNIEAVLSSGEDVTERKRSEQEYKTILATAMDCFWIVDNRGRFIDVNESYCKLIGYTREELLNMTIPDVEAEEKPEQTAAHIEKIIRTGYDRFETKHRCKDGSIVDVDVSTNFINIEGGRFYVFIRDITEKNMARKAIVKARDDAEKANRAKSEFLANMSHEIRTPMTSILGMAELLSDTKLNKEQKEYLERLRSSGDALIAIINDILDLSKIEAGQVELEEIEFNLAKELDKVISIFKDKAHKKSLKIASYISSEVPVVFIGDPVRIRQILVNIIGNAVKFTDSGSVKVVATMEEGYQGNGLCRLHLAVHDTGIGIEPEKLNHIFKEFVQSDASTTRIYGGTGLGLTISKKLVNLLNGEIWVKSIIGRGSTFHITLKLKAGTGETVDTSHQVKGLKDSHESGRSLKILLAEDSEDNRLLVEAFLKSSPHALDMAENGEVAFEMFLSSEYDLVLMDMQMPVMDGYEATRIIRKWEEDQHLERTPIVAFTAHALKEEVEQCIRVGCDGHISKPIRKKNLMNAILQYGIEKYEE